MMRRRLFALLFLLLLALPAQAQDEYEPEYERAACPFVPPENIEVECGTMIVPEDRADPLGNIVLIGVATFRATGRRPQPDPIFFLNGGPGSYTLETWGEDYSFNYLFAPFIEQRDVVLIDYRGVGSSEPNMFCDEVLDYTFDTLDDALTDAQATDSYTAAVNACRQRLIDFEGVNLRMYNSAVFAQDVADLRRVLGYDVINLFGVSYGTRLALTMLRDQPEGIRSVILDGVYPPQVDRSAENLPNVNRALEALFTACAASRECDAEYPDLRETFYSTARRLNAEPELLSVTLNSSGEAVELNLSC
jgi:pimeloyl-ACP methyl ester carboxylesterase